MKGNPKAKTFVTKLIPHSVTFIVSGFIVRNLVIRLDSVRLVLATLMRVFRRLGGRRFEGVGFQPALHCNTFRYCLHVSTLLCVVLKCLLRLSHVVVVLCVCGCNVLTSGWRVCVSLE